MTQSFLVTTAGDGTTSGETLVIVANDELDAARTAIRQGYSPYRIAPKPHGIWARLNTPLVPRDRLSVPTLALFAEQLSDMLRAGVTVELALTLLDDKAANEVTGRLSRRLLSKVRSGTSLSDALRSERGIPPAFIGIVQGAERGGTLAQGLESMASYLQRQEETTRKIHAALAYPAAVVVIAALAIAFILTVVIPEFSPLFSGEEARLPLVTRVVLFLSDVATDHAASTAITLGISTYITALAVRRSERLRRYLARASKRLPPVRYAATLDLARTTRVLGTLLSNGVDASEAMALAADAAYATNLKSQLQAGAQRVREGQALSQAFRQITDVPSVLVSLLSIGERTGDVGAAALRATSLIESDTHRRIDRLLSVLNPTAVILLGTLVAFFIAGVMLGIMSINQLALK